MRVGDVFTCKALEHANYRTKDRGVDRSRIGMGDPAAIICYTERKDGGWSREVQMPVDLRAHDPSRATAEFCVLSVEVAYGPPSGPGGPCSPSGHRVTAERMDGPIERLVFHTSRDFNDHLPGVVVTRHLSEEPS